MTHILYCTDIDNTAYDPKNPNSVAVFNQTLATIKSAGHQLTLAYVTGRTAPNASKLIKEVGLFTPQYIIGGVGTEVFDYRAQATPKFWQDALAQKSQAGWQAKSIISTVSETVLKNKFNCKIQDPEHLTAHKVSYHFTNATEDNLTLLSQDLNQNNLPHNIIYSSAVDLDILPEGCHKGSAIDALAQNLQQETESCPNIIIFSGDSGNDLAGFQANKLTHGIIVGNKPELVNPLKEQAIYQKFIHESAGLGPIHTSQGLLKILNSLKSP